MEHQKSNHVFTHLPRCIHNTSSILCKFLIQLFRFRVDWDAGKNLKRGTAKSRQDGC